MNTESRDEPLTLPVESGARVAVVLQSSFLGFFAHAGFMNALVDSGIRPGKISGASAGSVVASAYASGMEGEELRDFVLDRGLQRSFREWGVLFRGPAVFGAYRGHGLLTGNRAVKYLRRKLPVGLIEDAKNAELSIGVTNLSRKEKQVVRCGDMASFVVASCAISPIIRAQKIGGEYYLDGGFSDECPFEHWIDDPEVDVIVIHRIVHDRSVDVRWGRYTSFLACWVAVHKMVVDELNDVRIARAEAAGKKVVVHKTVVVPPRLVASQKLSRANYEAAYNTWDAEPSIVLNGGR